MKAGEIPPHVPEWKRLREEKKKESERRLLEKEQIRIRLVKKRATKHSRWTIFQQNNLRPYERSFKPRNTKVGERAEQNFNIFSQ